MIKGKKKTNPPVDFKFIFKFISRLLVNLTNPALLLYREELPKDAPSRRNFLQLIEILQGYKEAFTLPAVWAALGSRLQKALEIVSFFFFVIFFIFLYRPTQNKLKLFEKKMKNEIRKEFIISFFIFLKVYYFQIGFVMIFLFKVLSSC